MADSRIKIDTDDLRRVTRFTKGGLAELSAIKLDVVKAGTELAADPITSAAYYQVLSALDGIGTTMQGDHDALVAEVVAVETEQGLDPMAAPAPVVPVVDAAPDAAPGKGSSFRALEWKRFIPILLALDGTPPPVPVPWNKGWVDDKGGVSPQASTEVSFGQEWVTHKQGDGYDVYAGAEVHGSAGASAGTSSGPGGVDAEAEAHAHLGASAGAGGSFGDGRFGGSGSVSAEAGLDAEAHGKVHAGPDGVSGEVGASASAHASAEAEAELHAGGASVGGSAHAEASADAQAGAKGQVGPGGVSGSYEAGAGAKASAGAEGHASVAGTDAHYGAEVGVGVGVHAGGGFSFSPDDIGFDFSADLGLGIELGIDFGFHINPTEIFEGAKDLITHPADTVERWLGGGDSAPTPDAPPPAAPADQSGAMAAPGEPAALGPMKDLAAARPADLPASPVDGGIHLDRPLPVHDVAQPLPHHGPSGLEHHVGGADLLAGHHAGGADLPRDAGGPGLDGIAGHDIAASGHAPARDLGGSSPADGGFAAASGHAPARHAAVDGVAAGTDSPFAAASGHAPPKGPVVDAGGAPPSPPPVDAGQNVVDLDPPPIQEP